MDSGSVFTCNEFSIIHAIFGFNEQNEHCPFIKNMCNHARNTQRPWKLICRSENCKVGNLFGLSKTSLD